MKTKLLMVGLGAIATIVAAYLIWPEWFGLCTPRMSTAGPVCSSPYGYPYGVLTFPFSTVVLMVSVFASFTARPTFRRWLKFTVGYGIVATILLFLAGNVGLGFGLFSAPLFDIEKVAWLLAGIYGVLSLLILAISDFLIRRKR